MEIIDYRNSYAVNSSGCDGEEINTCRTRILARCELHDDAGDENGEFYLGQACIGEHMYLDQGIAQVPTSEVCIIFSDSAYKLLKKFAGHQNDVIQVTDPREKQRSFSGKWFYWTRWHYRLPRVPAQQLASAEAIFQAILDYRPLVGRTAIWDATGRRRAVIEYPIGYMNIHPPAGRFQVDVGPVPFPDFESTALPLISRLELAYVMFHDFGRSEFAVRVPTPVSPDCACQTLHYSRLITTDAVNEFFALQPEVRTKREASCSE